MKRSKEPKSLPRREFLKTAGLATGAAGAMVLAGSKAEAATGQGTGLAPEGSKSGYRETDHVRKYYELAR